VRGPARLRRLDSAQAVADGTGLTRSAEPVRRGAGAGSGVGAVPVGAVPVGAVAPGWPGAPAGPDAPGWLPRPPPRPTAILGTAVGGTPLGNAAGLPASPKMPS
jgi:hypothetical protein